MVGTELGRGVLALIGEMEGSKVTVKSGRFGTYINWKKVNAKMPQEYADDPSTLPLEVAWSLIEEKGGNSASGKGAKTKSGKKGEAGLPPAPKRPPSGYLHFCSAKRPDVAAEVKSLGQISKELARLWAEASDEDRAPFMALAKASKDEYDEEKAKWEAACHELVKSRKITSPKRVKGSRATERITTRSSGAASSSLSAAAAASPKRPKSAYLYFCAKHRPLVAQESMKLGDISKELARLWSEVSDADRAMYEEQATADKLRYQTEKMLGSPVDSLSPVVHKGRSEGTTTRPKKVVSAKSTGRGPSAYMLFCAEYRHTMVDQNGIKLSFGDTTKRLAQMWRECGEEERARFAAEAERQKELLAL
jgi:phage host-nuclease inhibitor protein Gam